MDTYCDQSQSSLKLVIQIRKACFPVLTPDGCNITAKYADDTYYDDILNKATSFNSTRAHISY